MPTEIFPLKHYCILLHYIIIKHNTVVVKASYSKLAVNMLVLSLTTVAVAVPLGSRSFEIHHVQQWKTSPTSFTCIVSV